MKIDDLTFGQLEYLVDWFSRAQSILAPNKGPAVPEPPLAMPAGGSGNLVGVSHSMQVGQSYLIRTVTMAYTGRLVAVTEADLVLEEAAWIADTGRYADAFTEGTLSEVEPYPGRVIVSRGALVDMAVWGHDLPREQK